MEKVFNRTIPVDRTENEKNDCSVRSVSLAFNCPYVLVHSLFNECGRKNKRGTYEYQIDEVVEKMCKITSQKYSKLKFSFNYTMRQLTEDYKTGIFVVVVKNHCSCVINGVIKDSHYNLNWKIESVYILQKQIETFGKDIAKPIIDIEL